MVQIIEKLGSIEDDCCKYIPCGTTLYFTTLLPPYVRCLISYTPPGCSLESTWPIQLSRVLQLLSFPVFHSSLSAESIIKHDCKLASIHPSEECAAILHNTANLTTIEASTTSIEQAQPV